jgi:hypothetical protein
VLQNSTMPALFTTFLVCGSYCARAGLKMLQAGRPVQLCALRKQQHHRQLVSNNQRVSPHPCYPPPPINCLKTCKSSPFKGARAGRPPTLSSCPKMGPIVITGFAPRGAVSGSPHYSVLKPWVRPGWHHLLQGHANRCDIVGVTYPIY